MMNDDAVCFITKVSSPASKANARVLINSLRTFGGGMSQSPVWIFETGSAPSCADLVSANVRAFPLRLPPEISRYPFSEVPAVCAQAEEMSSGAGRAVVWIDEACLVLNPPILLALGEEWDAAVRPVHIRNVGVRVTEPLDGFWRGVYTAVGVDDLAGQVESFIDRQFLRPYFNSHCFAFNPRLGLMRRWLELFSRLVGDVEFQQAACRDDPHQIFLFQALLSTLLVQSIGWERLRILPPTYNYPLHLHHRVPTERQAAALEELVSVTNEGGALCPDKFPGLDFGARFGVWLKKQYSL